ncbi:mechanosensitive ion channel [Methanomassiliicoccaceae archaeon DOK]|nr:mechanosensitive ion channel [Methanomassiliicoccaceae archaeon DOK]
MDVRRTTYVLLLVLMLSVAVPVAMGGDSDAAEQSDVIVNVDGSGDSITLDMESGTSKTATLYITNNSDSYLSLDVPTYDSDLILSSAKITVNGAESNLIYPKGDSDGRHIAVVTITVSVDRLTDTQTVEGNLTLRFTDVTVESTDGSNVFERQVPFTVNVNSVYTSEGSYNQFFGLFPNTLPAPLNEPWFTAVVTLVLWIVITIVVCELVIPQLTKIVGSRKTATEKKKLTQTLTKTISVLMFVVAVNECLNIIGTSAEIMSMVSTWSLVLYVLIGSVLAWQVYIFLVTAIINGLDDAVDVDGIDSSLIPLFRLIGKVVICVLAATIILAAFGVDLAGIMVSAGVITLGITFGAQEIISQFFSGIVLLSTRPFKKGDYISLNGTTYIVHKVRIMYTEFENWDRDQIVTMPNNAVTSATMINYTKGDPRTRIFIYVSVAYDADLTLAKELMIKAANMHPHVIKDKSCVPPNTRLTNFLDSGIEYRLACYVDDYDLSAHYAGQIREIIYKLFKDNGVEIPYNRLQIDILSDCDGKKRPDDKTPDD